LAVLGGAMDELTAWLKAESLSECAPYLQGMSLLQVISLSSLPTALLDEKPKLAKKLKSAIKAYKKSTFCCRTAGPLQVATLPTLNASCLLLHARFLDVVSTFYVFLGLESQSTVSERRKS